MPDDDFAEEWRDLGFFYDRDDGTREWRLRGSRAGLLKFSTILRDYSKDPRNERLGEHEHLGPYMYLEIGTSNVRVIDEHWIAGPLADLDVLSGLITKRVSQAKEGDVIRLREAYAPASPYELALEICGDDFDPAAEDRA